MAKKYLEDNGEHLIKRVGVQDSVPYVFNITITENAENYPLMTECISEWLKDKAQNKSLKKTTLAKYKSIVYSQLLPFFEESNLRVNQVKKSLLKRYINYLQNEGNKKTGGGLSSSYLREVQSILLQVFQCAIDDEYIMVNPAYKLKTPPIERKEKQVLTLDETKYIYDTLLKSEEEYALTVILPLRFGLRREEVAGLKWENINFHDGTMHVFNVRTRQESRDTPKSKNSDRILHLQEKDISLLKAHYEKEKIKHLKNNKKFNKKMYLFTTKKAMPLHPDTFSCIWTKFQEVYQFKKISYRNLRTTFATNLYRIGESVENTSQYLGHSDTRITKAIYIQLEKETANKGIGSQFYKFLDRDLEDFENIQEIA